MDAPDKAKRRTARVKRLNQAGSSLDQGTARIRPGSYTAGVPPSSLPLSAAQFQTIPEEVPEAIVFVDGGGQVRYMNAAARELFQGSIDPAWTAADWVEIYHLRDAQTGQRLAPHELPAIRALHGESVKDYEMLFRNTGEADDRRGRVSATPLYDDTGLITGAIIAIADVTREHLLLREMQASGEALRQSEERLRTLVSNIPVILFVLDQNGRFVLGEGRGLEKLGLRPNEWTGLSVFDVYRDQPEILEQTRRALSGEEFRSINTLSGLVFETQWTPMRDSAGVVTGIIGVAFDITERVEAGRQLQESEQRYRSLFEHNPDAVFSFTPDGRFTSANEACHLLTGYTVEEILVLPSFAPLLVPEDQDRAWAIFAQTRQGTPQHVDLTVKHKDGHHVMVHVTTVPIVIDGAIVGVYGIAKDVTLQRQAQDLLQHQALHDALTGLPNRVLLLDRLQQAVLMTRRGDPPVALLLLDLNHFKEVNDTFGHHYGDLLLQKAAHRLRMSLRATDTVARLGGDEFAIILPGDAREGALAAVDQIAMTLDTPFIVEEHTLHVGASIGIALCPDHGTDPDTLLRRADIAMYVAKRQGRPHTVYTAELDAYTPDRLALIADLRQAIQLDQLLLYFQPKVHLSTGRTRGVEVLVRWNHPDHGVLAPDSFIPLAEHTQQIIPLTHWVLHGAIRQAQLWRQDGLDLTVAVNLSAAALYDGGLPAFVEELLQNYMVPGHSLCVEITESTLLHDLARAQTLLSHLARHGIAVAIDDYGTGYSSLAYLKRLPVQELKIDRSFIRDMVEDETNATIVASTIALGHNLGLQVTAEGVESKDVRDYLARLACDAVQGYWFSPPVPAPELIRWLGTRAL